MQAERNKGDLPAKFSVGDRLKPVSWPLCSVKVLVIESGRVSGTYGTNAGIYTHDCLSAHFELLTKEFSVGDRVERLVDTDTGSYKAGERGVVTKINLDGTMAVQIDNGGTVPYARMSKHKPVESASDAKLLEELGDELCNHCPRTDFGDRAVNTAPYNLCEGSHCSKAKEVYLDQLHDEPKAGVTMDESVDTKTQLYQASLLEAINKNITSSMGAPKPLLHGRQPAKQSFEWLKIHNNGWFPTTTKENNMNVTITETKVLTDPSVAKVIEINGRDVTAINNEEQATMIRTSVRVEKDLRELHAESGLDHLEIQADEEKAQRKMLVKIFNKAAKNK